MANWRVGRSVGRTLYRDDVLVGMVDTPEIAAEIVAALNGRAQVLRAAADEVEKAAENARPDDAHGYGLQDGYVEVAHMLRERAGEE